MADSTTAKKPVDYTNWAEMEHEEEEDDQEIGIQQKGAAQEGGAGAEESKEATGDGAGAEGQTAEGGDDAGKDGKYPPRKRKDYGDKYDPNYKKGPWRKNIKPQEEHKRIVVPQQVRTKTDRGDYVVTSFQIPDRATAKGDKKELTEGEKTKKRRVGAFQLDDSDLEEEEQQAQAEETAQVEAPVVEEKKPEVVAAPVQ